MKNQAIKTKKEMKEEELAIIEKNCSGKSEGFRWAFTSGFCKGAKFGIITTILSRSWEESTPEERLLKEIHEMPDLGILEECIIGRMLTNASILKEVIEKVPSEKFKNAESRILFDEIKKMYDSDKPVDVITVYLQLKEDKLFCERDILQMLCNLVSDSEFEDISKLIKNILNRENKFKGGKEPTWKRTHKN